MLFVYDPDHLFSCDFESGAGGDGSSGGQTQPRYRCECFFSYEGVRGYERNGGFLPFLGNDGDFCATFLKIEDGIGGLALRKEELFWLQSNYCSTKPCACQKG